MDSWTPAVRINELPENARVIAFGHRSGMEAYMRCPRAYFYNYAYLGAGMNPLPTPLHFKIGSAVHYGLADMLSGDGVDDAVNHALDYLKSSRTFQALRPESQTEQEVLVHGLLYSFWVYAMPGIRENFDVLCVETGAVEFIPLASECPACQGLAANYTPNECPMCQGRSQSSLYVAMQSRPDAILRHKQTGEVAGWSWKTIDDPSDMRRSQLHNDLQGFMEMYYGERILEKLAGAPVTCEEIQRQLDYILSSAVNTPDASPLQLIKALQADLETLEHQAKSARNIPTQIDYIQTVFLVKGKRTRLENDETPFFMSSESYSNDTDEFGGYNPEYVYRQMSHLCYRYRNSEQTEEGQVELYKTGPNKGKPKQVAAARLADESWAYRFYCPDNSTMSGLSTKWLTSPIQPEDIRDWVDRLAAGEVFPSTLNDARNPHPLAKIIRFEEPLYRNGEKAARHVQQQRNRLIQIAGAVQRVNEHVSATEGIDMLDVLDAEFPQALINCKTPFKCAYFDFCHTPRDVEIDFASVPQGMEIRQPHHSFETEQREKEINEVAEA